MSLDLAKAHGWVVRELQEQRTIADSMDRLIDQCSTAFPHKGWQQFRDLPFADLSALAEWIEQPLRLEPPNSPLRGLWFGIFNPVYNETTVADFYISGSDHFDGDTNSNEWAVKPIWWPEGRRANSEIMASIYHLAYSKNGLGNDAEYPLCLAYVALAIRDLMNSINPRLMLSTVGRVGVAVGFDSGDFVLLGQFTNDGLAPL